jgi:hypothetical protein
LPRSGTEPTAKHSMLLSNPERSVLGPDPPHRRCILNGNAFQQDVLQTYRGWQYACFYSPLSSARNPSTASSAAVGGGGGTVRKTGEGRADPVFVHLSRRKLPRGDWNTLVFTDYPQTVDDGHNTVQVKLVNFYFFFHGRDFSSSVCHQSNDGENQSKTRQEKITLIRAEIALPDKSSASVLATEPYTFPTITTAIGIPTPFRHQATSPLQRSLSLES